MTTRKIKSVFKDLGITPIRSIEGKYKNTYDFTYYAVVLHKNQGVYICEFESNKVNIQIKSTEELMKAIKSA